MTSLVSRGASHTVVLAVVSPVVTLALSLVFSWVVLRSRNRFRLVFDFVAFLPHAVPAIVFGLGALLVGLFVLGGLNLYGSMTLLATNGFRYTTGFLLYPGIDHPEVSYAVRVFDEKYHHRCSCLGSVITLAPEV